ncbi:MAG: hypothetical protein SGBAC_008549 [Bacillariaceae sp.]
MQKKQKDTMLDLWGYDYTTASAVVSCLLLMAHLLIRLFKPPHTPSRSSSSNIQVEGDRSFLPLMGFETGYAVMVQTGVTTINFFPAKDVDFDMSKKKLKSRLKKICEANIWLVGTIIKDKKRHERLMCSFPNAVTDEDIDAIFSTEAFDSVDEISSSTSYEMLAKRIKESGAICRSGYKVVNKPDRVLKVSLFPINGNKEFAFVFSISHLMADGHTYYKVLSMLADGSTIDSLQVQRVDRFNEVVEQTIGKADKEVLQSGYIVGNLVCRKLFGPPISTASSNYIDPAKIAIAKQEEKESHSNDPNLFVSTNDIITSAYGKAVDSGVLVMALNLRGRTPEASENLAGNYETLLWFDKHGIETPAKIRQSLSRGPPFRRVSDKGPMTRWQEMTTTISLISSWIFPSFDADIHLWQKDGSPSSSVMLHLPLYVTVDGSPVPSLLVFKPCKGRLAVMSFYHANNNYHKRLIDGGEILGETVSAGMFASK